MFADHRFLIAGLLLALSALAARGQSQEMRDHSAAVTARDNARVARTQVQNADGITRQQLDLVESRLGDAWAWAYANQGTFTQQQWLEIQYQLNSAEFILVDGNADHAIGLINRGEPDGLFAEGDAAFNSGSWITAKLKYDAAREKYLPPTFNNPYSNFIAANDSAYWAQVAINNAYQARP